MGFPHLAKNKRDMGHPLVGGWDRVFTLGSVLGGGGLLAFVLDTQDFVLGYFQPFLRDSLVAMAWRLEPLEGTFAGFAGSPFTEKPNFFVFRDQVRLGLETFHEDFAGKLFVNERELTIEGVC